jgi:uroporphyrinogen-III synthase
VQPSLRGALATWQTRNKKLIILNKCQLLNLKIMIAKNTSQKNKTIISTRLNPYPQSVTNQLKNLGFDLISEPLFKVTKIKLDQNRFNQANLQAIIFTSANACNTIIDLNLDKNLKIFAIGQASANQLKLAGYNDIFYASKKNAESLKELILQKLDPAKGRVIYFCGESITLDFKSELEKQGFKVDKILSYKLTAIESLSKKFQEKLLNNQISQILLYSKNSAEVFFNLLKQLTLKHHIEKTSLQSIKITCLSDQILTKAQSLKKALSLDFIKMESFADDNLIKDFLTMD